MLMAWAWWIAGEVNPGGVHAGVVCGAQALALSGQLTSIGSAAHIGKRVI